MPKIIPKTDDSLTNVWRSQLQKKVTSPVTPAPFKDTSNKDIYGDYDTRNASGKPTIHKMSPAQKDFNVNEIVDQSIKQNVDPYLALAVSKQETQLGQYGNPIGDSTALFHLNPDDYEGKNAARGELGVRSVRDKMRYADQLQRKGKIGNTDESKYQTYEGQGHITLGMPELKGATSIYGVPIPPEGIDMKKTPLYGNIIKGNMDKFKQDKKLAKLINDKAVAGLTRPAEVNTKLYN